MKPCLTLAALLGGLAALPAQAFSPACERFLAAAEKSAAQPARHAVTEIDDGILAEAISVGGQSWLKADRGWKRLGLDMLAKERELTAQMRSGELPLEACELLGEDTVDGIATTAIRYRIAIPGTAPATATAHVGADGLVHAVSSDGTWVRYVYENVVAPAP